MRIFIKTLFVLMVSIQATASFEVKPVLDVHLHVAFDNPEIKPETLVKEHLQSNPEVRGFIISPSFMVDRHYPEKSETKKRILRRRWDKRTSSIVSDHPNRLLGLCGVSTDSLDMRSDIEYCLNQTGMIGLKFRGDRYNQFDSGHQDALSRILPDFLGKAKVILIHAPLEHHYAGGDLETDQGIIRFWLALAERMVGTQFIFAHSVTHKHENVELLIREIDGRKFDNIWIETSATLTDEYASQSDFLAAWKKFGLSRVIFGSDEFFGHSYEMTDVLKENPNYKLVNTYKRALQELGKISENPSSVALKGKILHENGEVLWNMLVGPRYINPGFKFNSSDDLLKEARTVLREFSKISKFDDFYFLEDYPEDNHWLREHNQEQIKEALEKRTEAEKMPPKTRVEHMVVEIIQKLKANPLLAPLGEEGYLNPYFVAKSEKLFWTYHGDYTIDISRHHLNWLHATLPKEKLYRVLLAILGHEIGHYVYDLNFHYNRSDQGNPKYADDDSERYLQYHVVVDAIGSLLTGISIKDYYSEVYPVFYESPVVTPQGQELIKKRSFYLKYLDTIP